MSKDSGADKKPDEPNFLQKRLYTYRKNTGPWLLLFLGFFLFDVDNLFVKFLAVIAWIGAIVLAVRTSGGESRQAGEGEVTIAGRVYLREELALQEKMSTRFVLFLFSLVLAVVGLFFLYYQLTQMGAAEEFRQQMRLSYHAFEDQNVHSGSAVYFYAGIGGILFVAVMIYTLLGRLFPRRYEFYKGDETIYFLSAKRVFPYPLQKKLVLSVLSAGLSLAGLMYVLHGGPRNDLPDDPFIEGGYAASMVLLLVCATFGIVGIPFLLFTGVATSIGVTADELKEAGIDVDTLKRARELPRL